MSTAQVKELGGCCNCPTGVIFSGNASAAKTYALPHEETMSRYDDLSLKYLKFRSRFEGAEKIAVDIAKVVSSSLDAPAQAVSPRAVAWDGDKWSLSPAGSAISKRHKDGRTYFAICVRLASKSDKNDPQILAILLSALIGGSDTVVRVEETQPKFSAHLGDPSALEDVAGEVIGVIEDVLDPDLSGEPPRLEIGFVDA